MNTNQRHASLQPQAFPPEEVFLMFFKIVIPAFLLTCLLLFGCHFFYYEIEVRTIEFKESAQSSLGVNSILNQFSSVVTDLQYLGTSGYFRSYLASPQNKGEKETLAREFLVLAKTKGIYDQIRFLGAKGDEVIRVNNNSGSPFIVAEEGLQNKGNRYYFRDAFALGCNEIFVSPLDLNMEKGAVEQPIKPMLRFGMPVCSAQQEKKGIILLNYLGAILLENLQRSLDKVDYDSDLMLMNKEGFWFISPNPKDEWGFMFDRDLTFGKRFPKEWEIIGKKRDGQLTTENGLFSFHSVAPLADLATEAVAGLSEMEKYYWLLVLHVPHQYFVDLQRKYLRNWSWQMALVSAIMLPLTWMFCREKVRSSVARREVLRSEAFTRAVTAQLGEGIIAVNKERRIVMINPAAQSLLGWGESHLLGADISTLFPERSEDQPEGESLWLIGEKPGNNKRVEPYVISSGSGEEIPVSLTISNLYLDDERVGYVLNFRNISKQLRYEEQLQKMAVHDFLTGAKNRRELEHTLSIELSSVKRYGGCCSILIADLDHFKKVNDTYGHPFGDEVLKHISNLFMQQLRDTDTLGRYGGEEFVAILPRTNEEEAGCFARRILEVVRTSPYHGDKHSVSVTVSLGLACCPNDGDEVAKLVSMADRALYEAKNRGRNQLVTVSSLKS